MFTTTIARQLLGASSLPPSPPLLGVGKRTSKPQGMKASFIPSKGGKTQAQHSVAGASRNMQLGQDRAKVRSHIIHYVAIKRYHRRYHH
ncbi:hypothetical protein I7I50_03049 [Histoplasma capsulatum G186AR]|uniref:Uncharacterized protein n=1 Tax=Ajellomyces capsulatus TaxID=5037 RepID=A0A8H7Z7M3_AJECA|nr:hypothetical protein I7I52_00285 [Histoplasma capsulatum]QSS72006.1 hypothetical protein I7I50_03049 [Histoplasma capsulatum G186AR]